MLVLLPPSEAKLGPATGTPLDLTTLSQPELTAARERVLDSLVKLCGKNLTTARTTLGFTPNQDDEIRRNAALRSEPAGPALSVFTGVLFAHLDAPTLDRTARTWLDRHILIASALLGFVTPNDQIPAYRLAADVTLPKVGGVATYWRKHAADSMNSHVADSLVLDCRSQQYAAMWHPTSAHIGQFVSVRVLQRTIIKGEPRLKVVSHHNKATKGVLVRALAQHRVKAKHASALHSALRDLGFESHLGPHATKHGDTWQLDVITDA